MENEKLLKEALILRAKAKAAEDDAKAWKQEANDIFDVIMPVLGITSFGVPGVGKISRSVRQGSSINKQKLLESLVMHGLDPNDINDILAQCQSNWQREVNRFTVKED